MPIDAHPPFYLAMLWTTGYAYAWMQDDIAYR
jgi:hypothetical protein